MPFPQTKKFFNNKSFINYPQKPPFYKSKTFACRPKTPTFFTNKSFPFTQAFPYRHPKQPFFALHLPFPPSHNLLFAKNTAILLSSALNPCAVTPEPRTDSNQPAMPGNVAVFYVAGYMMMAGHFYESHVSSGDLNRPRSPEVRKPLGYSPFFSYKRKE